MLALKNREALSEIVLESMTNGVSMRQACIKAGIGAATWIDWTTKDPVLSERYTRAREALLDAMVDQTLALADEPVPKLDNGATDPGLVRQRQLQVDTRKWILSKLAPSKYGDRLDVSVSDNRISISGALLAAQSRLALLHSADTVQDVQDVQAKPDQGEGGGPSD